MGHVFALILIKILLMFYQKIILREIESVLEFFNLTDRIIVGDKFDLVEQGIDWSKVNNILIEQREISMKKLNNLCEI